MIRASVCLLLLVATVIGQPTASVTITHPAGLPWDALKPFDSVTNPNGYPVANPLAWHPRLILGDITNDGQLDGLYVLEQRLLLAVTFTRNAQGQPISAQPLWAFFDSTGTMNKNPWSSDRALIWDLDGDGLNEVAWIGESATNGFELRVIDDNPSTCTGCANQLGNVPVPTFAATHVIDSLAPGWSFRARNAVTSASIANVRGLTQAQDLVVSSGQSNEAQIFSFSAAGGLNRIFSIPWRGQATHDPHYYDVTGDGREECLDNGYWDFFGCGKTFCGYGVVNGQPGYCATAGNNYDHADAAVPMGDLDNDGFPDILLVDDLWSKTMSGGPANGCGSFPTVVEPAAQLLFDHTLMHSTSNPFAQHGQGISAGQFISGPDACGRGGRQSLLVPKGAPFQNGGGPWGSFTMNDQMQILASSVTAANGPTGWNPQNIDWDGDRTTDEVFNTIGSNHSVFTLVPTNAGTCSAGTNPDPGGGPYAHPYRWQQIAQFSTTGSFQANMIHNAAMDVFGDSREELVIAGQTGIVFIFNNTPNPNAGRYLSPRASEDYMRRFAGPVTRSVNYQDMPVLERVSVTPATRGFTIGQSQTYTAIGHYSDGSTADVTTFATWATGDATVASFAGNSLTATGNGIASLQATVAGVSSNNAALAKVGTSTTPQVIYAGWRDTYLRAGIGSDLVMEVRVVDIQNDVIGVLAATNGVPELGFNFNDSGVNGDLVAGDGTWTSLTSGVSSPSVGDLRFEAVAIDATIGISGLWPYLPIPQATNAAVIDGLPLFPFVSENFGQGPFLDGTGILSSNVTQANGGVAVIVARVTDPSVIAISSFLAGGALGFNMNDNGTGADQLANDGLWTDQFTIPANAPAGRYIFEHLGVSATMVSDAYPRLRTHQ